MLLKTATLAIVVLFAGCSPGEERASSPDRNALRAILQDQRSAHIELDANRLVEHVAEQLVSIDSGRITVQTRGEVREMFERAATALRSELASGGQRANEE